VKIDDVAVPQSFTNLLYNERSASTGKHQLIGSLAYQHLG